MRFRLTEFDDEWTSAAMTAAFRQAPDDWTPISEHRLSLVELLLRNNTWIALLFVLVVDLPTLLFVFAVPGRPLLVLILVPIGLFLLTMLTLWGVMLKILTCATSVALFQEGLAWSTAFGGGCEKWEAIDQIYRRRSQWSTFYWANGRRHKMDHEIMQTRIIFRERREALLDVALVDYASMAKCVETKSRSRLLPRVRKTLKSGTFAEFGPLTVSKPGIAISTEQSSKFLKWNDVTDIRVLKKAEVFVISTRDGNKRSLLLDRIPNYEVLLALVDEISREANQGRSAIKGANAAADWTSDAQFRR